MTQHHDSASTMHASKCISNYQTQAGTHCLPAFLLRRRLDPVAGFYTTLHYTTLHYTTLHYTTLHYTTLHYTALLYTTRHHTTPLHYTNYLPLQMEGILYLRLCLRLLMLRRSLERYPGSPASATCVLSESLRDPEAWRDLLFSRRLHCCSREQ